MNSCLQRFSIQPYWKVFSIAIFFRCKENIQILRCIIITKLNVENFVTCIDKELNENKPDNFSGFASIYSETLDKCCKLDKPRNSKRTQQANPWLTTGIINACARKHELCKLWIRATKRKCIYRLTDSTSRSKCICYYCQDIIKCHETFKDYRRTLKHLIKNSKRGFYTEKITDCQGDSKKMWEIINGLRGKCKRQIKPQFIIDNVKITNRRVIANEFNKYFISIACKLI